MTRPCAARWIVAAVSALIVSLGASALVGVQPASPVTEVQAPPRAHVVPSRPPLVTNPHAAHVARHFPSSLPSAWLASSLLALGALTWLDATARRAHPDPLALPAPSVRGPPLLLAP